MASYTENLNLLKKDPLTEGNDTFNIKTMMNDNWDKLDAAHAKTVEALDALGISHAGTGTLFVYCKDPDGRPVSGCVVQTGEDIAVTTAAGMAKFFLAPGTHSLTVRSPIDYGAEAQTVSVTVALSDIATIEATILDTTDGTNELRLISSVPYAAFSDRITSADVFGVGGGGGLSYAYGNGVAATGGAGGFTGMALNIDPTKVLVVFVGAGGAGATKVNTSSTSSATSKGSNGGTTIVKDIYGDTVLSVLGGNGGNYISQDYPNCSGADGGSGSGGGYGHQSAGTTAGAYVGDSGSDGSDGDESGYGSEKGLGGKGQGRTTRLWGDANGELFASAGGSAVRTSSYLQNSSSGRPFGSVDQPGPGAGEAIDLHYGGDGDNMTSGGTYSAGSATTPGSGGGALVVRVGSKVACTVSRGNGMHGLVVFRWEVSA